MKGRMIATPHATPRKPAPLSEAEQETIACAIIVGLLRASTPSEEGAAILGLELRLAAHEPDHAGLRPLLDRALRLDAEELSKIKARVAELEAAHRAPAAD